MHRQARCHPLTRLALALLTVAVVGVAATQAADAGAPTVMGMRVQGPDKPTIGDRLKLVITLDAEAGTQVTLAPGALPPDLTLVGRPEVRTRDKGSARVEITLTAEVAVFFIGDYLLPPVRLRYTDSSGAAGEVETPPARLLVAGTLPEGAPLVPRGLKPQADLELVSVIPAWMLAAFAALVASLVATLALLLWRQSRPAPVAPAEPEPEPMQLQPEDRARLALDNVAADALSRGDLAAYYATLAVTVRRYLTDRFGFPAFALTTAELQQQMVRRGMGRWQARLVAGLLEQCDAVAFAGYRPAPERADGDLTTAFEIVEMSRPREPAEALP